MDKEKSLAKNIVIFAIGSIGSKLLQFLLIPFYTRVLTNSEYGTIDILQSLATLLIPIISLAISEAVFRYAMEENSDKKEVLSIGLFIGFINIVIMTIISAIIYKFTQYEYIIALVMYISTHIIRLILSQFTRAIGKVKIYTIDNILNVLITIVSNIVFLTILNQGINGYLLGYVVGNIFSIILLIIAVKIYKYITIKKFNKDIFKKMLIFSLPLIPSSICWWITNFTDRWMVTAVFGTSINGIYAISNKIPTIITIVVGIFIQAWQISANKEYKSKDISKFYSDIFKYLFAFVFIVCTIIMTGCKLITKIMVGAEFIESWYYMSVLLLGIAFFSMAEFLGTIYTASKKTNMAFITNMVAAITNIFMNMILLNSIGPIGAAVATAICYFVLWIYRVFNTKKIIPIDYNIKAIILTVILLTINAIIVTIQIQLWYIFSTLISILIIVINFEYVVGFVKSIINMVKEKLVNK